METKTWNTGSMCFAEVTIIAPVDFAPRYVRNLTQNIVMMKSTPYIFSSNKNVNAKSILGLLSADIKKGDTLKVQTVNCHSCEQSKSDLEFVVELINNY